MACATINGIISSATINQPFVATPTINFVVTVNTIKNIFARVARNRIIIIRADQSLNISECIACCLYAAISASEEIEAYCRCANRTNL